MPTDANSDREPEPDWLTVSIVILMPQEQLAFWNALNAPVVLTPAQRRLAAIMRGEA